MRINTANNHNTENPQADAIVPVGNPTIPAANGTNFFEHLPDELIVLIMMYLFNRATLEKTPALAQFKATCRQFYGVAQGELESLHFPQRFYQVHFPIATQKLFGNTMPSNINWASLVSVENTTFSLDRGAAPKETQRLALTGQFKRLRTIDELDSRSVSPIALLSPYDNQHSLLTNIAPFRDTAGQSPASQFCQWFYGTHIREEYQHTNKRGRLITHTGAIEVLGRNTLLHWAAMLGDGETVEALLPLLGGENGFNVLAENDDNLRPLECAILTHNMPALRALLNNNEVIVAYAYHLRNSKDISPFEIAAKWNNLPAFELLTANATLFNVYLKNNVVLQDNDRQTALTHAALEGHANIVKKLLNHPDIKAALLEHYRRYPNSVLIKNIASAGHFDIIKAIFEHHELKSALITPLFPDNDHDTSNLDPLNEAVLRGNIDEVRFYLNDPEMAELRKQHPYSVQKIVLLAANKKHYALLTLLLETLHIQQCCPLSDLLYEVAFQSAQDHPEKYAVLARLLNDDTFLSVYQPSRIANRTPLHGAMHGQDIQALHLLLNNQWLRQKVIADMPLNANKNPLFHCHNMDMLNGILAHDDLVTACAAHIKNDQGETPLNALLRSTVLIEERVKVAVTLLEHPTLRRALLKENDFSFLSTAIEYFPGQAFKQLRALLAVDEIRQYLLNTPARSETLLRQAEHYKKRSFFNIIVEHSDKTVQRACYKYFRNRGITPYEQDGHFFTLIASPSPSSIHGPLFRSFKKMLYLDFKEGKINIAHPITGDSGFHRFVRLAKSNAPFADYYKRPSNAQYMAQNKKGQLVLCLAAKNEAIPYLQKHTILMGTLNAYIQQREADPTESHTVGFFARSIVTKAAEINAATTLSACLYDPQTSVASLKTTSHYRALQQGTLGKIYKAALQLKSPLLGSRQNLSSAR